MRTSMALVTNAIAVVVNLALNVLLIQYIGVLGAGIATAVSYFVLWVVRIKDTARIIKIRYPKLLMVVAVLVLIGQAVMVSLDVSVVLTYVVCTVGTATLVLLFRKTFLELFRFVVKLLRKQ